MLFEGSEIFILWIKKEIAAHGDKYIVLTFSIQINYYSFVFICEKTMFSYCYYNDQTLSFLIFILLLSNQ